MQYKLICVALGATLSLQAQTVATPTISNQPYGFNVVPNALRRIVAQPDGSATTSYKWSVSGACTLKNISGAFVDIVAPSSGSACSVNASNIFSNATCTLSATSLVDPTKSDSIVVNICAPSVQVTTVPFYTTLYSGQAADIQAMVWGNANRNVSWRIASQPSGGDGTLDDTGNEDTVFQATVGGRYALQVTSQADPLKSATAIIYVTGHPMPYNVTKNKTMPVDCSVDPAMTGTVYDVGPARPYQTLKSIAWDTLTPGSTVRIHNDDVTGTSPTKYAEYFQPSSSGTATQPIRICGVPDQYGNLPIISAINATGRTNTSIYAAGYALVDILNTGFSLYGQPNPAPKYIIVEGLSTQHSNQSYTYVSPNGSVAYWLAGAAGIRVSNGQNIVIRGNDIGDNGNGFFNDAQTPESKMTRNVLFEGNYLHQNSTSSGKQHQAYIQAFGQVTQFNYFGALRSGATGSQLKSRGVYDIVRYNYFGDTSLRLNDFVENQDATGYSTFAGWMSLHTSYPTDQYTPDLVAAAQQAFHNHFVYGNSYVNSTATKLVHFFADSAGNEAVRQGDLWFYNNSVYQEPSSAYRYYLFDVYDNGLNLPHAEWQSIQAVNNVIWFAPSLANPYFYWTNLRTGFITLGKNLISSGWGNNNQSCTSTFCDGTGWPGAIPSVAYMDGIDLPLHVKGASGLLTTSTAPFDTSTLIPQSGSVAIGAAQALPSNLTTLPVRFQYSPRVGFATRRTDHDLGALGSNAP
ncbi:MAG: hypothetical protein NVS9B15_09850 [Acidobacteriaceae bacterium]